MPSGTDKQASRLFLDTLQGGLYNGIRPSTKANSLRLNTFWRLVPAKPARLRGIRERPGSRPGGGLRRMQEWMTS